MTEEQFKTYSLEEIAEHSSEDSLWLLIDNGIYDVTKFQDKHPGGPELLLEYAGEEATDAFEDIRHSSNARNQLKQYKIGELSEMKKEEKKISAKSSWMETKLPSIANIERFKNDNPEALSKKQVQSFFEEGYIVLEQLLSEEDIAKVKELVERSFPKAREIAQRNANLQNINTDYRCDYYTDNDPKAASILARHNGDRTVSIKLISWIGGIEPELIVIGRQSKITIPVAQLLGSNKMDHLINQIHYKMPSEDSLKHPVVFDWHQDEQHRRNFDPNWEDVNKKGSFMQVITAVDENTVDNGPLVVIPKSHMEYLHLHKVPPNEIPELIKNRFESHQFKTLLLKPGDTVFMHPLLVHKSDVNHSSKSRELFINGFSFYSSDGQRANRKPYPGTGSTEEMTIGVPCELLDETNEFIKMLPNIQYQNPLKCEK